MKSKNLKASELRIGNFTTLGVVCLIEDDVFRVADSDGDTFKNTWADIEPIPLTEEWLLKFGFQKSMSWTYVVELKGNLKLVYYLGEKGWSIGFKSYSDFSNLEYVHQLQNLYFALTGEELTLKSEQ